VPAAAIKLSIVIPAFNECMKVQGDIIAAAEFLTCSKLSGEIILVDDGSADATAAVATDALAKTGASGKVIRLESNRGKGCAVRTGITASCGEYILFADSGMCVPFSNALRGLDMLSLHHCDIANGSRRLKESVICCGTSHYRSFTSWMFRHMMPFIAGTPRRLSDTQCGFKMYRGTIGRELYSKCTCDGFMFDIEVILLAVRAKCRIAEFPVEWSSDYDSRLHPVRYLPRMIKEIVAIRREVSLAASR